MGIGGQMVERIDADQGAIHDIGIEDRAADHFDIGITGWIFSDVEDTYPGSSVAELAHQMGADESGAPCYQGDGLTHRAHSRHAH